MPIDNRRIELEALMADFVEAPPLLHPSMAQRYREQVGAIIETLNGDEHRAEAAELIRSLVEKVVLTPDEGENRLVADLYGKRRPRPIGGAALKASPAS